MNNQVLTRRQTPGQRHRLKSERRSRKKVFCCDGFDATGAYTVSHSVNF